MKLLSVDTNAKTIKGQRKGYIRPLWLLAKKEKNKMTLEQINTESKRTRNLLSLKRHLEVYEVMMNQLGSSHTGWKNDIFHQGRREAIAKLETKPINTR